MIKFFALLFFCTDSYSLACDVLIFLLTFVSRFASNTATRHNNRLFRSHNENKNEAKNEIKSETKTQTPQWIKSLNAYGDLCRDGCRCHKGRRHPFKYYTPVIDNLEDKIKPLSDLEIDLAIEWAALNPNFVDDDNDNRNRNGCTIQ